MTVLLRHQALLALMAVVIFFTNLGSYALFNEDEPKNASCGAEMFRRGDVIVPTFNEALRTDKPILIYWLMLAGTAIGDLAEPKFRWWRCGLWAVFGGAGRDQFSWRRSAAAWPRSRSRPWPSY